MAKLNKEDEAYLRGLGRALDLVKAGGLPMLEREIEWRGSVTGIPTGVTNAILTSIARNMIKPELKVLSTALAYTMEFEMQFPSRTIAKFLKIFNDKVDEYRASQVKLENDSKRLDYDYGLTQQVNEWYQSACERDKELPQITTEEGDNNDDF